MANKPTDCAPAAIEPSCRSAARLVPAAIKLTHASRGSNRESTASFALSSVGSRAFFRANLRIWRRYGKTGNEHLARSSQIAVRGSAKTEPGQDPATPGLG